MTSQPLSQKTNLYVPVFSITLFLSAFLLFSIQPLFGKMILPLLGGTPAVWNLAMLFYQGVLLLGYLYAHISSKYLNIRTQGILQIALFVVFALILPFGIAAGVEPPTAPSQIPLWQFTLMATAIGGPFFVLAGCAPMLQHWFYHTDHKDAGNPYFLYAASNVGSMLALLSYPFFFEPAYTLPEQSLLWKYGYLALIGLIALSLSFVWYRKRKQDDTHPDHPAHIADPQNNDDALQSTQHDHTIIYGGQPNWRLRFIWLLLSFLPSSLMLGVTTYISTDIAAFPLLWVVPLALYVVTFIIAFSNRQFVSLRVIRGVYTMMLYITMITFVIHIPFNGFTLVGIHFFTFFAAALLCHITLVSKRPAPRYLTEFYLIMSVGGVCGGIFNSLLAPVIFTLPIEYGLILGATAFIRYMNIPGQSISHIKEQMLSNTGIGVTILLIFVMMVLQWAGAISSISLLLLTLLCFILLLIAVESKRWLFGMTIFVFFATFHGNFTVPNTDEIYKKRNFFGVMRVYKDHTNHLVRFFDGTTMHGSQSTRPDYKMMPFSYYYKTSGGGNVMTYFDHIAGPQKIALIGLGTGSLVCCTKPERFYDIYEINPDIVKMAENKDYFSYLSDCGSPYKIILGDARLKLRNAEDHSYDVIYLDAFSSDNIPIHLITKEAFQLYFQKLKPNGVIVTHITNRYLDLKPIVAAQAKALGAGSLFKIDPPGKVNPDDPHSVNYLATIYGVVSKDKQRLKDIDKNYPLWAGDVTPAPRVWTDNYANPLSVMDTIIVGPKKKDDEKSAAPVDIPAQ